MSENFYIVRGDRSGVFFGHIKERNGQEVVMTDVRRIWYWEGAASLSQLAVDGVSCPRKCKFAMTVSSITILDAIELIPCTDKARDSILRVSEWKV